MIYIEIEKALFSGFCSVSCDRESEWMNTWSRRRRRRYIYNHDYDYTDDDDDDYDYDR